MECAVVLIVLLILLFGVLDVGRATYGYVTLAESCRRIARQAIVHGASDGGRLAVWGPAPYQGTAVDGSEIASTLAPLLPLLDDEQVVIEIEWLDGDNRPGDRVRVRVREPFEPLAPGLLGIGACDLSASSTMRINH